MSDDCLTRPPYSRESILGSHFTGQGVSLLDGNTIEVLNNQRLARIRFNGIDCQTVRAI
jgi:endonuclease YncB( thermonuclease family)